jgi:hypothetical protein
MRSWSPATGAPRRQVRWPSERAPASLELTLFAMIPAALLAVGSHSGGPAPGPHPRSLVRAATFVAWAFPGLYPCADPRTVCLTVGSRRNGMSQWASALVNSTSFTATPACSPLTRFSTAPAPVGRRGAPPGLPAFTGTGRMGSADAHHAFLAAGREGQDYITTARPKGCTKATSCPPRAAQRHPSSHFGRRVSIRC